MEGYINEEIEPVMDDDENEGGQLKQKNGQKYVVNQRQSGFYVSKPCTILLLILTLAAMMAIFLLTYFLLIPSCHSNNGYESNETLHVAGIHSSMNGHSHSNGHSYEEIQITTNPSKLETTRISTTRTTKKKSTKHNKHNDFDDDIDEVQSDEVYEDKENELIFYEGWNPINYKLIIEPNFETLTNNGTVAIDIMRDLKVRGVKPISVDVNEIIITSVDVVNGVTGEKISYESYYGNDNTSFHVLLTETVDHIVNFTVSLGFVSQLTETLQGFYRGSYIDENQKESFFASTQFSPIDARRAFPCFDRPEKKATFEISVVRPYEKDTVLSNMPHSFSSLHRPGYVQEDFEKTPKMSTYLSAFHISNLKKADHENSEIDIDQPTINIWARKDVLDMTNYAHRLTKKLLPYLESYFNIKYKLPKIDMIAVPDFGFSGMENWGMITFRESALLVPENNGRSSSPEHLEVVASVIAHELSHQWFGNLVTPKWWSDLWLKEGFAVFMSYECLNHVEPNWRMWDMFPLNELQKAMEKDSDTSSHPISFSVTKPSDIRRIFDPISYSKGASIIRMMSSFLGRDAFKAGISQYLKTFSHSNADQNDLWEIMTDVGHTFKTLPDELDLKRVMDSWTLQAGYPVITVKRNDTDLVISQHRYILPHKNENDTQRWYIPITLATKQDRLGQEQPQYWMTNKMDEMEISDAVNTTDWVYLNINRTGYYRVNYDYDSWKRLIRNFTELPSVIKAQLIDDAFQLARAEYIDYDIPLTFLIVLAPHTKDIPAWAAAEKALQYLTDMVIREPLYESYRGVMRTVLKGPFESVGFDEVNKEEHQKSMHRARILKLACEFGIDRCTNRAQILFRDWMRNAAENKIPPSLKNVVYCTSLREGGVAEWQFAYKQYKDTSSASEKELLLSSLGCTTKPWLLSKYLNLTLTASSDIRKQDGARAFTSVAKNFVGYEIAYDFLYTNIAEIARYYGTGFSTVSKMIDAVTTHMNSEYHKEQFMKFTRKARKLGLTSIEKSIKLAEEQINNNIYWKSRSYYKLNDYLNIFIRDMHINVS